MRSQAVQGVVSLAAAFAWAFWGAADETVKLDGVAASVNGKAITIGEVRMMAEPVVRQLPGKFAGAELTNRVRRAYAEALNALVERRLILDAAEKKKMKLPDWVVERRINEIIHERFCDDRTELMQALAEDRMTFAEWRERINEQIVISAMRSENVERHVSVSPAAVRQYYETHAQEFKQPGRVNLRAIVLYKDKRPESAAAQRALADDLRSRIKTDEDFAALAKSHSQDTKAAQGGAWGWTEAKLLKQELAKAATALAPGEVSQIIETDDGFYVLKSEGRQEEGVVPFEDVRAQIQKNLERAESETLHRRWIERLKAQAHVNVTEDGDL